MMVAWIKVMAINMKTWADFDYILEKELTGLDNKVTMGMVVRERAESWMIQGFDLNNRVDIAPICDVR